MRNISLAISLSFLSFFIACPQSSPAVLSALPDDFQVNLTSEIPEFSISPNVQRLPLEADVWNAFLAVTYPVSCDGSSCTPEPTIDWSTERAVPQFLSWRTADDLFPAEHVAPKPWDSALTNVVCSGQNSRKNQLTLNMVTKFGTVLDDVTEADGSPLPDQHGLLTSFSIYYNKAFYDHILNNKLYLTNNWPENPEKNIEGQPAKKIVFPVVPDSPTNAVMIKTAWRDLTLEPKSMYPYFYTTEAAYVPNESACTKVGTQLVCDCQTKVVGLVGLHFVIKPFPGWIWSTFEHRCNLCGEGCPIPELAQCNTSNYKSDSSGPTAGFDYQPRWFNNPCKSLDDCPNGYTCGSDSTCQSQACTKDEDCEADNAVCLNERCSAKPVTIHRVFPIESIGPVDTHSLNTAVQKAIADNNPQDWRQYYNLVATQWGQGEAKTAGGTSDIDIKPSGADNVANITMETYNQNFTCLKCHLSSFKSGADFSFGLKFRSWKEGVSSVYEHPNQSLAWPQ